MPMKAVVQYGGTTNLVYCPGFSQGSRIWKYNPKYGYIIGYNYLGGHNFSTTNFPSYVSWISPQRMTDGSMLPLMVDPNHWDTEDRWAIIPHGPSGAPRGERGGSFIWNNGVAAWQSKAAGGNVGLLDGSVHWRNKGQLSNHIASTHHDRYIGAW